MLTIKWLIFWDILVGRDMWFSISSCNPNWASPSTDHWVSHLKFIDISLQLFFIFQKKLYFILKLLILFFRFFSNILFLSLIHFLQIFYLDFMIVLQINMMLFKLIIYNFKIVYYFLQFFYFSMSMILTIIFLD